MKKSLLGLIALSGALSATAHAQSSAPDTKIAPDVPPLITDRPDFTESSQTVPKGRTQIEAGVTFERSGREKSTTYGETLVRIAAGDSAEIRVGIPSYITQRGGGAKADGFDNSFLGAKFALVKRENFPISVLVGTTLPTGSHRVASRKTNYEAALATETELSKKLASRLTSVPVALTKAVGASASSSVARRLALICPNASALMPRFTPSTATNAAAIPSSSSTAVLPTRLIPICSSTHAPVWDWATKWTAPITSPALA